MSQSSQKIYENLRSIDDVNRLIVEKTTEGLYLEFKEKSNKSQPDLSNSDKENFSEALSQFANSDGGVLIFGVKTSKPNDYASELSPIINPKEFLHRLLDFALYAVQPSVDELEGKVIDNDDKSGFVIFLIPASLKTPHRSLVTREYLKRGQNGKYKMEHFDLEDMFGRRQKPSLSIELIPVTKKKLSLLHEDKSVIGYLGSLEYDIFIHNDGRAVAKNSLLILTSSSDKLAKFEVVPTHGSGAVVSNISTIRLGTPTVQISLVNSIFYPTVAGRIATLKLRISISDFDSMNNVPISWAVYAEDMASKIGVVNVEFKNQIEF
ncbi:MAG: ATP-binding protein [Patescibacteria group bacterium]